MKTLEESCINPLLHGMSRSATLAINERSDALRHEGKTIYKCGLGQSPFPVPTEVVNTLKLYAQEKDYLPVKGLPALREAVADFHRRKDHVDAQPSGVLVGPGSKELLFLLQLVFQGELIAPTPCWVSYVPQARILGRQVHLVHTDFADKWRIMPDRLAEVCERNGQQPRILVLNYPGNPEGASYTAAELKELADVARRFQLIVLSDEIYGQLHHRGEHVSIARFYPEGTIMSSGLSKWCGAGGWRLGTFTFPKDLWWLCEAMAVVASETYTSVSAPIQYAAVRAFRGGISIERYLWHARRILASLAQQCTDALVRADVRVHLPVGAFYLFLDFSPLAERLTRYGISDSRALCERLLCDTGVALLPGAAFHRPPEELTARMAYVNFDGAKALAASETIPLDQTLPEDFVQFWCEDVLEATQHIVHWISQHGGKP